MPARCPASARCLVRVLVVGAIQTLRTVMIVTARGIATMFALLLVVTVVALALPVVGIDVAPPLHPVAAIVLSMENTTAILLDVAATPVMLVAGGAMMDIVNAARPEGDVDRLLLPARTRTCHHRVLSSWSGTIQSVRV